MQQADMQTEIPVSLPILFSVGQWLEHVKTGGQYQVVGTPAWYVLEHSREPAYAYKMADGRVCVRCQSEMEDGRFVVIEKDESISFINCQFQNSSSDHGHVVVSSTTPLPQFTIPDEN